MGKRKRSKSTRILNTQVDVGPPSKNAKEFMLIGEMRVGVMADSVAEATKRLDHALNHPTVDVILKRYGLTVLEMRPKRYGLVKKAADNVRRILTRDTRLVGSDQKPLKGGQ